MDYLVDRHINLTALTRDRCHNAMAIRHDLMAMGLKFAEANQFTMFAMYGFMEPKGKRTLSHENAWRLSILDEYNPKTK